MKIASEKIQLNCLESDIYNRLELDNKHILELGCGGAIKTRDIATTGVNRQLSALEVDEIAYEKNLLIKDLPNVTFTLAGAQDIPLQDETVDVVFMFKSLHHVPVDMMEKAMLEIRRVLKPGGIAYISEPVYGGEYNDILRLFHDEKKVREAAFAVLTKVVEEGLFKLVDEIFFYAPVKFKNFTEFEENTIKVTYGNYKLDEKVYKQVKQGFEQYLEEDGVTFSQPIRVDLLQK